MGYDPAVRWLLPLYGLLALVGCSEPCRTVSGTWTGEFWGDSLEGTLVLELTANAADDTRASVLGTFTPTDYSVESDNVSGLYHCPGAGDIEGLSLEWEREGQGGTELWYGSFYGYLESTLEADGEWEADVWTPAGVLIQMHDGEWAAWHESSS